MKQRIMYILKHNLYIQKLYKIIMGTLFRLMGLFIKVDPKMILFSSFMGSNFNDSPRVIYDYIKACTDYKDYYCVWAFENPEKFPDLKTVKIDTFAYFVTALKAKYWVTNTNIERGLTFKKKNQVYLNTWHGVALKYIGNDCPGRKDYNFRTIDYLCVSGDHDEKVFKTAFYAKEDCYLRCGMPRNDILWNHDESQKERAREELGIPDGKKVILYAPTWRDSVDGGKTYAIKPPIDFGKWEQLLGEEYILLFRAHHLTTKIMDVQFNGFIRDVSDYRDVNTLMMAADMLITDYSAIAFDYSVLCRPILTFAYDYEEYLDQRGTYFDMDKRYPSPSCRTEEELLWRIRELNYEIESANTRVFRDAFIQYGGSATQQCVEALLK